MDSVKLLMITDNYHDDVYYFINQCIGVLYYWRTYSWFILVWFQVLT